MVFGNLSTGYWLGAAAAGTLHWTELGRTTLSGTADTIDVTGLANKPYLMAITHIIDDTTGNPVLVQRLNSSNATDYAQRYSADHGSDSTNTNIDGIYGTDGIGAGTSAFGISNILNASSQEKLLQATFTADRAGAGSGYAPNSWEIVGKRAVTDNITACSIDNNNDGNFASGSEVVVLGYDPDDTEGGSVWQELASVTAGGSSTNLSSGTIAAKKYLMVGIYTDGTTGDTNITFNNDTGSNYSWRRQINGGTTDPNTSQNNLGNTHFVGSSGVAGYSTMYIINKSDKEKLVISESLHQNAAGAGNAPDRTEVVGKWANSSAQITEIDIDSTTGNFNTNSVLKVWGFD